MVYIKYAYYFANCRLEVREENDLLSAGPLSSFRKEIPYASEMQLSVTSSPVATYKDVDYIAGSSGINIGRIKSGGWLFSYDDKRNPCAIQASPDYARLQGYSGQYENERALRENFMQLLRLAVECRLTYDNGVSLHASCVVSRKEAVLFTAPSGMGKSTQARIWQEYLGADIINGDRPFLHLFSGQVRAHGVPWDGKEQIFLQEDYPVKAIVEVRKSSSNRLRRLSRGQAFNLMLKQCFIPMWDDAAKFFTVRTIRRITQDIPFYRFFCLPDLSAARLLQDILFKNHHTLLKDVQTDMRLKKGFILKNIADEWVVMPTGKNVRNFEGAIVLNDVSAFIWQQLEKPISREDLLQAVLDEYDIGKETAAADLDELLERLQALDILETCDTVDGSQSV